VYRQIGQMVVLWLILAMSIAWAPVHAFVSPRPASERIMLPFQEQTMSMVFTPDGTLYVGTANELHRFDGAVWESLGLGHVAAIRSLHVDINGRVWVGGYDRFGYLERLPNGRDRFVDLSPLFAAEHAAERIADIWEFAETKDAVYLRALKHLFAIDHQGKRIGAWMHPGRMGNPAVVGGELWAQYRGEGGGFRRLLPDGGSVPIAGSDKLSDPLILSLLEFAPNRLLVLDGIGQLRWFDPTTGKVDLVPQHPGFRHMVQILRSGPEEIVAAGDDGVLRSYDFVSGTLTELDIGNGFQPAMQALPDHRFAVLDDNSVHRLQWPVQWRIVDARNGLKGNPRGHALIGNHLYALSSSGAQAADYGPLGVESDFTDFDWTSGEAWDLVGQPDDLLLAETFRVLRIKGGEITPITPDDLYPRRFIAKRDGNGYWIGTEHGVALIEKVGPDWVFRGHTNNPGTVVHTIAECDGHLFAGSQSWGAFRVVLENNIPVNVVPLSVADGVSENNYADVFTFDDRCYLSIAGALLEWNGTRFVAETTLGLAGMLGPTDVVHVDVAPGGRLWAISTGRILFRDPGQPWATLLLRGQAGNQYQGTAVLPDGRLLLSQASELWQLAVEPAPMPEPDVTVLRATRLQSLGGSVASDLPLDGGARVTSGTEGLSIQFTDGVLFSDAPAEYSFRIDGLDAAWSPYSPFNGAQLSALPPGSYRLDLKARRHGHERVQDDVLLFEVVPRWYQGTGTRMAALVAGIALLWAMIALWYRGHLRRLTDTNRRLDELVDQRTAMWQQANLELKQQADRDGLTGVANRRVFDRELAERVSLGVRDGAPFALLMIDVDHFKRFNDEFGHLRGDEVLKQVAALMRATLGGDGMLARYGGEEFGVLLYEECSAAREVGERLRAAVEAGASGITVSVGLACFDRTKHGRPDQLIDAADHALYEAKKAGRNRLVVG